MTEKKTEKFKPETEGDQLDFNIFEYINLIRKHFWLICLAGMVGAVISLAFFAIKPKQYKATAVLKLDPSYHDNLDFGNAGQWQYNSYYFRTEYLNTEFQEMRSRPVLNKIIDNLGLEFFDENFPENQSSLNLISLIMNRNQEVRELTPEEIIENKKERARRILKSGFRITEQRQTHLVNVTYISLIPHVAQKITNTWIKF